MVERIFISYRRDDSAGHAGRVFDRLKADFGGDVLFMDVDAIPLGANFVRVLRDEVGRCSVLLAIIGSGWLDAKDGDGGRRLENPNDFVRVEIATALARDIPVIPILLEGGRIPKIHELPGNLSELAERQGLEVRHTSFHGDMDKLVRALKSMPSKVAAAATEVAPIAPAPVAQQLTATPLVDALDLPLLPDGTIDVMEIIDTSIVEGLIWPKTPVLPSVSTVDEVIADKGKWARGIEEYLKLDENFLSDGLFIVCGKYCMLRSMGRVEYGAIIQAKNVRIIYNDLIHRAFWMMDFIPVHGYAVEHTLGHNMTLDAIAFLGFEWRPEYAELSDAVFKKLGGKPLANFIKHP